MRVLISAPRVRASGVARVGELLEEGLGAMGCQVHRMRVGSAGGRGWLRRAFLLPKIVGLRISFWPDLVIINPSFDPKGVLRGAVEALAWRALGVRVLAWFHGGRPRSLGALGWAPKLISRLSAASLVLSRVQEEGARSLGMVRVVRGKNPVDTSLFSPGEPEHPPFLLFVGRLVPEKGPWVFLSAVKALIAQGHGLRFALVGEGPLLGELAEAIREEGLPGAVVSSGKEDLARLLARAWALVLPTTWPEGAPMVVLEAMASGVPVVASPEGATPDLVGDAGLLVEPEARAVAKALSAVLDPGVRETLGARARKRALRFSVERVVRELYFRLRWKGFLAE